jgi:hypothetical protein
MFPTVSSHAVADETAAAALYAANTFTVRDPKQGGYPPVTKAWPLHPEGLKNRNYTKNTAQVPVLVVGGGLDILTPLPLMESMNTWLKPKTVFIDPFGTHTDSVSNGSGGCSWKAMMTFINNTDATLDKTCQKSLSDLVDFSGNKPSSLQFAQQYLDGSMWGN